MPSTDHSLLGALLACALALSQAALASSQASPDRVSDPILGVPLSWSQLPPFETPILGEPERRDRRELARVAAGHNQLVLVLSLIPIHADLDGDSAPLGYEVDSGQLVKRIGSFASPLGTSSGDLPGDYPELREELIAELLDSYVSAIRLQYPDPVDLLDRIEASPICADFGSKLLSVLDSNALAPRKCAAPMIGDSRSTHTRNSSNPVQAHPIHSAANPGNEASDSQ